MKAVRKLLNHHGEVLLNPSGIASGLTQCAADLSRWNTLTFGQVPKQIQKKNEALKYMVLRDRDGSMGGNINALRKEISELLDSKEIMWQQRSKVQWLRLGDRNTKYFHFKGSERKTKNTIVRLQDENGNWSESNESIVATAASYFEKLYITSLPSRISEVIDSIPARVTEEMNQSLIREFTKEEVTAALQQMPSNQSSRTRWYVYNFFSKLLGYYW